MTAEEIAHIASLLEKGLSPQEIAQTLNEADADTLYAAEFDDSDEAIAARYGVSDDDTFDTSGERMRPSVNDAGEPWWM